MGIYIRGMAMPGSCILCRLECLYRIHSSTTRSEHCPLVEVDDHKTEPREQFIVVKDGKPTVMYRQNKPQTRVDEDGRVWEYRNGNWWQLGKTKPQYHADVECNYKDCDNCGHKEYCPQRKTEPQLEQVRCGHYTCRNYETCKNNEWQGCIYEPKIKSQTACDTCKYNEDDYDLCEPMVEGECKYEPHMESTKG